MGLFTSILGGVFSQKIAKKSQHVTKTAAEVIDTLFTSDEERLDKQAVMARIVQQADALQTAINNSEARHKSRFVAGWRPFIGWVCGIALAWHFVVLPSLQFIMASFGFTPSTMPHFEMSELHTILFGLLGLGTLRTAEKAVGKN